MLANGRSVRADAGDGLCAVQGAEAAGDFLLHLEHAQVLFGLIVGERDGRITQEGEAILAEMLALRYGRDGRPLTDCKAAILGTS